MRINFYTPFKPLDHSHPSGDLTIGRGLYDYLKKCGHQVYTAGSLRTRWIYWKPWLLLNALKERQRIMRQILQNKPDMWLTYHTYYKAPDILGPGVCRKAKIPYLIFQGMYSTKRKKKLRTLPGFVLNKIALCAAHHVFTNRLEDLTNLERILPEHRLTYVKPGIYPSDFCFDSEARSELRRSWNVENEPVVLSAAMFRPDVKSEGLAWVIRACGRLVKKGMRLYLVIAGDGKESDKLRKLAKDNLADRVRFVGKIPRTEMNRFYSAGDIFAFPGFNESLGMVFLEAQSCAIPVVAFSNGGIPEVVKDNETGFLEPLYDFDRFTQAIQTLLANRELRLTMGKAAESYIRQDHDLNKNYQKVEQVIEEIILPKLAVGRLTH